MLSSWMGQQITASALSLTVAGNTGISSFLTLLVLGFIFRFQPDLLGMAKQIISEVGEDGEEILTEIGPESATLSVIGSIPGLVILSILTLLEIIAMCVPVVDEITDTIMTFVIPAVSALGVMSTWHVFPSASSSTTADDYADEEGRRLNQISDKLQMFWQIVVMVLGISLALMMHLFKMLVRLIGVGWLTNILAVLETVWTVVTLCVAIYVKTFAIFVACFLVTIAFWGLCRRRRRDLEMAKREQNPRKNWCWNRRKRDPSSASPAERSSEESRKVPDVETARSSQASSANTTKSQNRSWTTLSSKNAPEVEGRQTEFTTLSLLSFGSSSSTTPAPKKKYFWQRKEKSPEDSSKTISTKNDYQVMT